MAMSDTTTGNLTGRVVRCFADDIGAGDFIHAWREFGKLSKEAQEEYVRKAQILGRFEKLKKLENLKNATHETCGEEMQFESEEDMRIEVCGSKG